VRTHHPFPISVCVYVARALQVQGLLVALAAAMGSTDALGAALSTHGSPHLAARASAVLAGSIQVRGI